MSCYVVTINKEYVMWCCNYK